MRYFNFPLRALLYAYLDMWGRALPWRSPSLRGRGERGERRAKIDGGLVSAQGICRRTGTARTQRGSELSS